MYDLLPCSRRTPRLLWSWLSAPPRSGNGTRRTARRDGGLFSNGRIANVDFTATLKHQSMESRPGLDIEDRTPLERMGDSQPPHAIPPGDGPHPSVRTKLLSSDRLPRPNRRLVIEAGRPARPPISRVFPQQTVVPAGASQGGCATVRGCAPRRQKLPTANPLLCPKAGSAGHTVDLSLGRASVRGHRAPWHECSLSFS